MWHNNWGVLYYQGKSALLLPRNISATQTRELPETRLRIRL